GATVRARGPDRHVPADHRGGRARGGRRDRGRAGSRPRGDGRAGRGGPPPRTQARRTDAGRPAAPEPLAGPGPGPHPTGMTKICIAGITGWVGAPLAQAVLRADDLELVGGVARSGAGQRVEGSEVAIAASVDDALDGAAADVLIDYTAPGAVRGNAEA